MAYDYSPAYRKRRNQAINARRELRKLGVPSSSLPSLPKSTQKPTQKQAREMTEYLSNMKVLVRAEKYVQKHQEASREERIIVEQNKIVNRRERDRQRREANRIRNINNIEPIYTVNSVMVDNFLDRIDKIPVFTTRSGKSYTGKNVILKWWRTMAMMLTVDQLGSLLAEAQRAGIIVEVEKLYDETVASKFVSEMMDFLRRSNILDNEEYDMLIDEMEYVKEKGRDYEY